MSDSLRKWTLTKIRQIAILGWEMFKIRGLFDYPTSDICRKCQTCRGDCWHVRSFSPALFGVNLWNKTCTLTVVHVPSNQENSLLCLWKIYWTVWSKTKFTDFGDRLCIGYQNWYPLAANVSSQFHHMANTGTAVGSLVKWLPIKVAHTHKLDTVEWFIARRLEMAPSDWNRL